MKITSKFALLFMILSLFGCETIESPLEIKSEYSHDSLKAFITHRYIDSNTSSVMNLDDRAIIYTAAFNDYQPKFLYKPIKEFRAFCEAKGGKLTMQKGVYSIEDVLPNERPLYMYLNNLNSEMYYYDSSASVIADESDNLANSYVEVREYFEAMKSGAFGVFYCEKNKKNIWGVSILPLSYKDLISNNPNSMADYLHILITPFDYDQYGSPSKIIHDAGNYKNGSKMYEITYKNSVKNGMFTTWYSNGQKKSEVPYSHNIRNGLATFWLENGEKWKEVNYDYGEVKYTNYYKNGVKV